MKNKLVTLEEVTKMIKDDTKILLGGFATIGTPERLVDAVIESNAQNLTVVCNDSGFEGHGLSRIVAKKQVGHLIASHIGMNPETARQMNAGEMKVTLVPQGTLAERIRAAGAGLGGVLTTTGLGTEIQDGKEVIHIEGKDYLLELPLRGDIALLRGSVVDKMGNIYYKGTTQNFNPLMATAAEIVVVEAEELVEVGEIEPEMIMTPGVLVDYILVEE